MRSCTVAITLALLLCVAPWKASGQQASAKGDAEGQAETSVKEDGEGQVQASGTDLLTRMIQQTVKLQKLDPWMLPDKEFDVDKEIMLGQRIRSHITVTNGILTGLSNIQRTGPCYIQADEKGLRLNFDLGISRVKLHYKGVMTFKNETRNVDIDGKVKKARAILNIGQKDATHVVVKKFKVDKLKGLKVSLKEIGQKKSAVFGVILKATRTFIEHYIRKNLEKTITEELNKRLMQGEEYLSSKGNAVKA